MNNIKQNDDDMFEEIEKWGFAHLLGCVEAARLRIEATAMMVRGINGDYISSRQKSALLSAIIDITEPLMDVEKVVQAVVGHYAPELTEDLFGDRRRDAA